MRKREPQSNMAKEIETPRTNPNSPRTGELVSSMSSSKLSTIEDEENQAQALSKLIPGTSANVKGEELKVLEKQLIGLTRGWYIFPTLKDYSITRQLASDIIAGITVGSLAVPQSMSYAMIAGLPVQNGLYSDLQIAYPILGSSRHLVVGPVAIMSLLTMEALKGTGVAPLSAQWIVLCSLLSCFVGLYQLVFAGMQAGEMISTAVSENSVKAFTACAALTIASTQIPSLLGVACDDGGTTSCGSYYLLKRGLVDDPNGISLIVSGLSLIILEGVRTTFKDRLVAKMGSLIVMFIGIKIAMMIPYGFVQTVGYIPQGLPSTSPVTSYFSVETVHVIRLALSAGPISLLGFAEAYAIAKAKSKDALNPNRELAALGLANVWTAFLGGYACTGSFSRSAVNAEAGSSSGISCFVSAAFVVLVLQMLTTELSMLPKACVAAVVVSAIVRLIDYKYPKRLYMNGEKRHLLAYCIIFITGLTFGVEVGLLLGFTMDTINRLSGRSLAPVAEMLEWRETSPKHRWIF